MFKKIITYFIILAIVAPLFATVVPIGGGVKTAYAADNNQMIDPCDIGVAKSMLKIFIGQGAAAVSVWHCAIYSITWISYAVVLKGSVVIAGWASDLFNLSIQFSLSGKIFDANKNPMIEIGWTMVRDLFNLIFIFILLYAAISTILQYGNVDIKKILPGLIIAALLVNFSLMISKVVIDASHIFSFAFYERINTTDNGKYAEFRSSVEVNEGFKKKNLADVFLAGFNPQSLLTGTVSETIIKDEKGKEIKTETNTESQWYHVVNEATKNGDKFMDVIWKLLMIIGLESALAIFSAFILIVVASMFVVRVVVLWMLMIFSPIAFLGFVLPSMEKHSKKWWDTLISQSFFAPAFLFMFMLSTEFVNSKIMQGMLNITPNDAFKMGAGMDGGGIITVIFNFLIIGALMLFSLQTAKSMGGYSADFAQKGRDFLLGRANKMLWKPTRYGGRYLGGVAGDSNWWNKSIGRIPGGSMLSRKLGAMKKADEDKTRKAAEKYAGTLSKAGITSLSKDKERGLIGRAIYGGGVFKPTREGYQNVIAKKKSEKDEKTRYKNILAELAEYDDDKDKNGNIIDGRSKGDKIGYKLDAGQRKDIDEEIEKVTKKIEDAYQQAIDLLEDQITTTTVDLTEKNSRLYKAIEDGSPVDILKLEIVKLEKDKNKYNGQKAIMEKKKKEREDKIKIVEKFEAKQETEKLGAKFSSAGGGSGSGGGGAKKP